jgi:glutamate/tyrosine decarboxylase-like PLP-dependent enzyme
MSAFPEKGRDQDEVLAALTDHRARDLKSDGRAFAFVYDAGESTRALAREAFASCMAINGLDPTVYPSARKIENAVVAACLELLHAPEGAAGTATAGGTERDARGETARDYARRRGRRSHPKMLLPGHRARVLPQGRALLRRRIVSVDVDPVTMRASVADARAKMRRT